MTGYGTGTAPKCTGSGGVQRIFGVGTSPKATGVGTVITCGRITGQATAPKCTGHGYRYLITGKPTAPKCTGQGFVHLPGFITGKGTAKKVTGQGKVSVSAHTSGIGTAPKCTGYGIINVQKAYGSNAFAPSPTGSGYIYQKLTITGSATSPKVWGSGRLSVIISDTYVGWVINTMHNGGAQYSGYNFRSLVKYQNRYFGCGPSGIFELTGKDDNGQPIQASWLSGISTAWDDDHLKYFPYAYPTSQVDNSRNVSPPHTAPKCFGASYGKALQLTLNADPDPESTPQIYDVVINRVKLADGVSGRHVQVGFNNVNGAGVKMDKIDLTVVPARSVR